MTLDLTQKCDAILIGDLNLDPDTESIKILEKEMRNLVKKYSIQTTRSDLYSKKEIMPLADYCFVSP